MTDAIRIERLGPVTVVTIDRPERRNAVDRETAAALADAFRAFDRDDEAAVAVLTGAGGTFCAGADLRSFAEGRGNRVEADGDGPMGSTPLMLSKPVIAAVAGYAVAGGWNWPAGAICGWLRRTQYSACSVGAGACH